MSATYFRVVAKDFDLSLSGVCVVEWYDIVSKEFGKFFYRNKSQIMIIKLLKGEFRKE